MWEYMLSYTIKHGGSEILLDDLQLFFFVQALGHLGCHLPPTGYKVSKALFLFLLSHFQMFSGDL